MSPPLFLSPPPLRPSSPPLIIRTLSFTYKPRLDVQGNVEDQLAVLTQLLRRGSTTDCDRTTLVPYESLDNVPWSALEDLQELGVVQIDTDDFGCKIIASI